MANNKTVTFKIDEDLQEEFRKMVKIHTGGAGYSKVISKMMQNFLEDCADNIDLILEEEDAEQRRLLELKRARLLALTKSRLQE